MTPAQSVSITDIANRRFASEISTPGCALILPVGNNDFLTICGDGTLMLVQVDDNGNESNRVRSRRFFDLQEDAVYDRPVPSNEGWQLFTHGGTAMHVTASAIFGVGLAKMWQRTSRRGGGFDIDVCVRYYIAAAVLHGAYNAVVIVLSLTGVLKF